MIGTTSVIVETDLKTLSKDSPKRLKWKREVVSSVSQQ